MRLVIQRVKNSKVVVDDKVVGEIGPGLLVLLGIGEGDNSDSVSNLVHKLVNLRVLADENGKMNLSIRDTEGEVLVVSQFTLYADTSAGNRPSFIKAAEPVVAQPLYEQFVEKLKEEGIRIATGSFGEHMEIESVADGPVTINLEA